MPKNVDFTIFWPEIGPNFLFSRPEKDPKNKRSEARISGNLIGSYASVQGTEDHEPALASCTPHFL